MKRAAAIAVVMVACAGCGVLPAGSPAVDLAPRSIVPSSSGEAGSTVRTHEDVLVIIGSGSDHVVITQPLVEIFPPAREDPAILNLEFTEVGMMGIEGGIGFASVIAEDGTIVADRIVDLEGDSLEIPPTTFTVRLYYRPCDGHCGVLDPAIEWCTVERTFRAGETYDITVDGSAPSGSICDVDT